MTLLAISMSVGVIFLATVEKWMLAPPAQGWFDDRYLLFRFRNDEFSAAFYELNRAIAILTDNRGVILFADTEIICIDCGKHEVWTEEDQNWGRNVYRCEMDTKNVSCRECRIAKRRATLKL